MEERKRGRNRRDEFYVKTVYYSGGVFKIAQAPRLFRVDRKRAKQIINRLLYEGVLLNKKKPIILFRRAGFRGDKIRMVTHASSTEILLTIILVLSLVSIPFLNYLLPQADETYRLAKLVTELSISSALLKYYGLVILAFNIYTKRLCELDKKLRLRVRFKYKHKSEFKDIEVKENITVKQLIELALKRMKKDRIIVENYDAILDRDNNPPLTLQDSSKRLYEYRIRDKDKILIESVKRRDGLSGRAILGQVDR
jgi:hypothetical protein